MLKNPFNKNSPVSRYQSLINQINYIRKRFKNIKR